MYPWRRIFKWVIVHTFQKPEQRCSIIFSIQDYQVWPLSYEWRILLRVHTFVARTLCIPCGKKVVILYPNTQLCLPIWRMFRVWCIFLLQLGASSHLQHSLSRYTQCLVENLCSNLRLHRFPESSLSKRFFQDAHCEVYITSTHQMIIFLQNFLSKFMTNCPKTLPTLTETLNQSTNERYWKLPTTQGTR